MSRYSSIPKSNSRRHPSHLKGKEIGLFYARRNKERKLEDKQPFTLERVSVSMGKQRSIEEILSKCSTGTANLSKSSAKAVSAVIAEATSSSSTTSLQSYIKPPSYDHIGDSMFKRDFLQTINGSIGDKIRDSSSKSLNPILSMDQNLYDELATMKSRVKYKEMLHKRELLPAYQMRDAIIEIIRSNRIVVISGETGCGKTTQIAQFILDDFIERRMGSVCQVVCTQPRRISAITVAERVADERGESLGQSVGYQIRLEKKMPRKLGSICFCTTGVVLRLMEGDPSLWAISHLIIDEIHERDVSTDFLLALIKQVIIKRPSLKVVLMSATLNAEKFSQYFNDAPYLNIPGFTYPVEEFYLEDVLEMVRFKYPEPKFKRFLKEDRKAVEEKKNEEFYNHILPAVRLLEKERKYPKFVIEQLRNKDSEEINIQLILELLIYICRNKANDGAILVFVTGFSDISALSEEMERSGRFPSSYYRVFPLHSQMPTVDQKQIFQPTPKGVRKIVISTNIAETSVTIDDVVYVVDCGKIKMTSFDVETNTEMLQQEWVAIANANQRKGRAGRVKPGICYHLFTRARRTLLEEYQIPQILRERLENVILTAKILQLGNIEPFFQQLIDSPDPKGTALALNLLKQLNALDGGENLTPLGYHLAKLPIAPQLGKMILLGAIFSCLDPILSIAATLDFKDPFYMPLNKADEVNRKKLELARNLDSDHLLFHEVIKRYEESHGDCHSFCREYFLSWYTLKLLINMKGQFMEHLCNLNFVSDTNPKNINCNRNSHNIDLIKAIICAALYPNFLVARKKGKTPHHSGDSKVHKLHPKSILSTTRYFSSRVLVYYMKLKSCADYIHDCTLVNALPLIFFADQFVIQSSDRSGHSFIAISNDYNFIADDETVEILRKLRDKFNWFLEYKISHPGPVDWMQVSTDPDLRLLEAVMLLFHTN